MKPSWAAEAARISAWRALPREVVSSERARITSPASPSSLETSRRAASTASCLGVADDHVRPVAESQLPPVAGRPRADVGDRLGDPVDRVGPHQEHVGRLRGDLLGVVGEAAEVERGAAAGRPDARRVELEVVEVAVMGDALAVEQRAQYVHDLERARVPGRRLQRRPGEVGGDDVDRQPAAEDLVDGRQLTRELRRPHLAHPHREQQLHPPQQRRDPGRECDRVDPHRVAGGQQQVVVAAGLGGERDVAAVRPAGLERRVADPEELVVVVAQRGEPGDLEFVHLGKGNPGSELAKRCAVSRRAR